ncbi:PAS domain S-box-containing protein [Desulfotomaculum arcticum]|uniref:PAS domain S-box-containing protein n=1 Tax=Desulfotruncus arcticus DSM 17038 TaxID=1121424 RepID=A0A1I2S1P7_9FIRM|nr:sigma 54-interacting transcriptional regulator [Desulfotruncus arcticus]SFG46253.1 PAS domain S-box-containing protein [Desulfotomaculum arcticum] [Desulfotruncus arcticus DSM 17038]
MLNNRIKVAIIGIGDDAISVYNLLKNLKDIEVASFFNIYDEILPSNLLKENNIVFHNSLDKIFRINGLDIVINAVKDTKVEEKLKQIRGNVSIIETGSVNLMVRLFQEKQELLKIKGIQGELSTILNSIQEAVEVAGKDGVIKYLNPAFVRVTGIPAEERIGKNVLEASPDGALAMALRTGKNVFGHRTKVGGSNAEVISNASPIIIDGSLEGAVVVFQHFTDVMKLMDELKQRTSQIENLSDKFGQVTTCKYGFSDIIGESNELKKCMQLAEKSARSNTTVLLLGESGTGKELFAHAIHHVSSRREKPFIKVNCAAIPENLLESEFFGYAKGAFTGAVKSKIGKFELANGGTIFLDEIGDMNLALQGKLLRVLQEMEFEKVGGNQTIHVDVRVVAATNRNLREMIRNGNFREDLYYRLNVVEITIPPLRLRKDDLPELVDNLIVKLNRKLGKKVQGISKDAEEILYSYDWPGNVRELENVVERVMVTVDDEVLKKKHFVQHVSQFKALPEKDIDLMPIEQMEQLLIKKALSKFGNTVEGKRRAAQALNISLATLYNKLKKAKFENSNI